MINETEEFIKTIILTNQVMDIFQYTKRLIDDNWSNMDSYVKILPIVYMTEQER